MPTDSSHQRQATHNQDFIDSIDSSKFSDWVATAAFYKAVHLVSGLFAISGEKPSKSHNKRNAILRQKFPTVWKRYRTLYCYSRLARYWCMLPTSEDVENIRACLQKLEFEVQNQRTKASRKTKK